MNGIIGKKSYCNNGRKNSFRESVLAIKIGLSLLSVMFCSLAANGSLAQTGVAVQKNSGNSGNELGTISFSRLLVRVDGELEIGIAPDDYRVLIIEALRKEGFNVKGAENLLFDQDNSDEARFILGATLTDLDCTGGNPRNFRGVCDMAVEWQLFDRSRDMVVYKVLTRSFINVVGKMAPETVIKKLVLSTLTSLMRKPLFSEAQKEDDPQDKTAEYPLATFRHCETPAISLPTDMETVLNASVLVKRGKGVGSGFLISGDGVIITAAHVVSHKRVVDIELNNGTKGTAQVIRTDVEHDVALLQADIATGQCLALNTEPIKTGIALYAVGSPAAKELAFSVSQGIVSGVREIDDKWFVQTDASVSPGNSGGPMLDEQGRVIAVTSWKIALRGHEGLGFGVPTETVIKSLAIQSGERTTVRAATPTADVQTSNSAYPIVDTPDMTRSQVRQQRIQEQARIESQRAAENAKAKEAYEEIINKWEKDVAPIKKKRRPYFVLGTTLSIIGVGALISGGVAKTKSTESRNVADRYYDYWLSATTPLAISEFEKAYKKEIDHSDKLNGAAIGLLCGGAASIVTGIILLIAAPDLPAKPEFSRRNISLRPFVSPNAVGLMGHF